MHVDLYGSGRDHFGSKGWSMNVLQKRGETGSLKGVLEWGSKKCVIGYVFNKQNWEGDIPLKNVGMGID